MKKPVTIQGIMLAVLEGIAGGARGSTPRSKAAWMVRTLSVCWQIGQAGACCGTSVCAARLVSLKGGFIVDAIVRNLSSILLASRANSAEAPLHPRCITPMKTQYARTFSTKERLLPYNAAFSVPRGAAERQERCPS